MKKALRKALSLDMPAAVTLKAKVPCEAATGTSIEMARLRRELAAEGLAVTVSCGGAAR